MRKAISPEITLPSCRLEVVCLKIEHCDFGKHKRLQLAAQSGHKFASSLGTILINVSMVSLRDLIEWWKGPLLLGLFR